MGSAPGAVVRPFAWALRRLRFSRNAAPRRRCWLAFSVLFGRSSMAARIRAGATRRKADSRADATVGGDGPCLRRFGPYGKDRRIRGRIPSISHSARRCRSSVVEHSLGKGEVVSSILTGSTRKAHEIRAFSIPHFQFATFRYATKREHDVSTRGKSVDFDRRLFAPGAGS